MTTHHLSQRRACGLIGITRRNFPSGTGGRSQSSATPATARVGRGTAPLGLSDASSDTSPRGLVGQSQALRAALSPGRTVTAQTATAQTVESFARGACAAADGKPNVGRRFHSRQSGQRSPVSHLRSARRKESRELGDRSRRIAHRRAGKERAGTIGCEPRSAERNFHR